MATNRADLPPNSGLIVVGKLFCAVWNGCYAESQAAALFFMAPTIAVSMAPPATA